MVTDPSQAAIVGATVEVTNTGTGVVTRTTTNAAGFYVFPNLTPATYSLNVSQAGFRSYRQVGVVLATADRKRLDVQIQVGSVEERVEVVADATMLQLSSAEFGSTVAAREYDRLPQIQLNRMRSPATFLYLSPGVLGNVNNNGRDNVAASNQIQINGSGKFTNEIYLDGLPGRTNFNEVAPPVDAVSEFKLQANQLSAEYGNTGSAVVAFTLKSGTNALHGTAFNIFRNEKLDARSFLAPNRAPLRQNEFGLTVGGPVLIPKFYDGRDKTFFFFSYSGSRKRGLDQVFRRRVATPQQITGDFEGQRIVFDPATTTATGTGFTRTPFTNNQIPTNRIDPVAARVAALLPPPNLTGAGSLNYQAFAGERLLDPDVFTGRVDHAPSGTQRMYVTYNRTDIPRQNITSPMEDPFSDRTLQMITSHTVRGNHDWVLSPNVLNTFLVGYNYFRNPFSGFFANQGFAERFGLRGIIGDTFPTFSFTDGYAPLGRNSSSDGTEGALIFKNTTSLTLNRHVIKVGAEYRHNYSTSVAADNTAGAYAFNALGTANPGQGATTGDGFASFLLGQVHSGSMNFPFSTSVRRPYMGIFFQDDFRATNRLTLNLGFRYEVSFAPWELDNRYVLVDLQTPNPAAGNRPGAAIFAGSGPQLAGQRRLLQTNYGAVGPRFGFAYSLRPRTVLRGGYGIFYGDPGVGIVTTGLRQIVNLQSLDAGITPAFTLAEGFPAVSSAAPQPNPGLLNGLAVTARNGTVNRPPRTQNWSLSLQQELAQDWMVELNYVANHTTGATNPGLTNINQVDASNLSLGSLLTQQVTSTAARQAGIPIPYEGFRGSVAQALRPFPQYLTVTEQAAKAGRSFYNGASARLRKRFSRGLQFEASYTWSRNLGYSNPGEAGFGTTNNVLQDDGNRRLEWSLLPNDVTHAVVGFWTYDLPVGKGKRWGGWQLSGIHRYQSGVPLSIFTTNTLPIFNRVLRPDAVPGVDRPTGISLGDFQPGIDRRINPDAFTLPGAFRFGTAAPTYNDIRNFPVLNEDFSLIKNTRITESTSIELSTQFINALNRHRFADINVNRNTPLFGQASGSNLGRIITLGAKIRF
ncbi:MAG: carboxypeptidase-like regulatory domain-containing protein [Bryobacterales bacterium]|nr:carboxypeptidase-like regulatory domain-containing protein [Bryobacterales bacterium]